MVVVPTPELRARAEERDGAVLYALLERNVDAAGVGFDCEIAVAVGAFGLLESAMNDPVGGELASNPNGDRGEETESVDEHEHCEKPCKDLSHGESLTRDEAAFGAARWGGVEVVAALGAEAGFLAAE